jgi:carboxyl-terminal processing protease
MYYLLHPNLLKQYPTAEKFATSFNDAGEGWQLLVSMAKKDSIDIGLLTGKDKEFLQKSVKALVGRQLYRTEGYFIVQNQKDGEVQKALELIQKN